ncbi:hypothetical protein AQ505_18680 [Pedobacter sp. PACM 27299]|uniref:hypothetical protein n=1 Tax=Pedobacter sp. PACM 27299 TaxID=1727164 RepID=UPI000705F7D9|nr:hypothetical protein [Pedobacter sp. PACM 27299]ALL07333.1 hypothetical protein AQ505_18680 [Pedobacter sp. PACM 27299]
MKWNSYLLLILIIFPVLVFSQDRFKGGSKEKFKASKDKIAAGLDAAGKEKLELALRVLAFSAIYDRDHQPALKKENFDELVWKRLNGKNLEEAYAMANQYVKEDYQRKVDKLEKEMGTLDAKKKKSDALKQKLGALKAKPLSVDVISGQFVILCAFTNESDQVLTTYETVIGYGSTTDINDGWSCVKGPAEGVSFAPKETKVLSCSFSFETVKQNSNVINWKEMTFPLTDFNTYHLAMDCYTNMLVLDGQKYELKNEERLTEQEEAELLKYKTELAQLKANVPALEDLIVKKP